MKAARNSTGLTRLLLFESAHIQYNPPPKCNVGSSITYRKKEEKLDGKRNPEPLPNAELQCQVPKHKKEAYDTINREQNKRLKVKDKYVALTKQPLYSPFNFNSYPNSKHDTVTSQGIVPTVYPTLHEVVPILETGHTPREL